ncbi:hypothetical protein [Clostridium paraputrificum]|uniref:hypothetical protein n=1 Tax=Clostridium paraputrificum TaxID=29363 RepID=UPI00374E38E0
MLQDLVKDITNWLNFAEAKNIALITFDSAWLTFWLKRFHENSIKEYKVIYAFISIIYIVALIICLISFIPKLFDKNIIEKRLKKSLDKKSSKDNMLFYKDIFKYSEEEYYKELKDRGLYSKNSIEGSEEDINKYEKALVKQIVTLSGITYKKYYLFNISLVISIIPLVIIILGIIIA